VKTLIFTKIEKIVFLFALFSFCMPAGQGTAKLHTAGGCSAYLHSGGKIFHFH
jgi:hypothetical protein